MSEWHPISSAPNDGETYFLIGYWGSDDRWYAVPCRMSPSVGFVADDGRRVSGTHWHPISPPPIKLPTNAEAREVLERDREKMYRDLLTRDQHPQDVDGG